MNRPVKTTVLGVGITSDTSRSILEYVVDLLENSKEKCIIFTPNPEMVVAASKDRSIQDLLNKADLALCDGVGLYLASHLVAKGVPGRIAGVDFVKSLCENVSEKPINIGFLGGRTNVAEKTAECLLSLHPTLRVVFAGEEWGKEGFDNAQKIMTRIKSLHNSKGHNDTPRGTDKSSRQYESATVDILFVAYGFPKQEKWIANNLEKLPIRVAMGVGGTFDYLSGRVSRAPFLVRSLGLEWMYRLVRQPWRLKRQLALFEFIGLVLKAKISN